MNMIMTMRNGKYLVAISSVLLQILRSQPTARNFQSIGILQFRDCGSELVDRMAATVKLFQLGLVGLTLIFLICGWLFNFWHAMPLKLFFRRITSPDTRMHMFNAAFSVGFIRSSFRHYFAWLWMQVQGVRVVEKGSMVPECRLISVDGKRLLLSDFVRKSHNNILILVMGSYT